MDFKHLKTLMQNNFASLTKDADCLFEVNVDKDKMWNLYLTAFRPARMRFIVSGVSMIAPAAGIL